MSSIFVSYSSQDSNWAERIRDWLQQQGYRSLFLDFDIEAGIGIVGRRLWRTTLYQKLRLSRALIAFCSQAFLASKWCLLEVAIATDQSKDVLPLLIDPAGELPERL